MVIKKKISKKEKVESKKLSEEDFKKEVIRLAEKGLTAEKIGEELRKQGIHSKEHNQKISKILKEKEIYVNPDLNNIEKKLTAIKSHYEKNKQDKKAMREKERIFSRLRTLKKYHGVETR